MLASFLSAIALAGAFHMYLSIRLSHMMRDLLRGLGLRVGDARVAWDSWFLVAISAMSVVGIIGVLWRKGWSRMVSSSVLGALFAWATAMSAVPQAQLEDWFSTRVDRWPAAGIAAVMLIGLVWLGSTRAQFESQRTRTAW